MNEGWVEHEAYLKSKSKEKKISAKPGAGSRRPTGLQPSQLEPLSAAKATPARNTDGKPMPSRLADGRASLDQPQRDVLQVTEMRGIALSREAADAFLEADVNGDQVARHDTPS